MRIGGGQPRLGAVVLDGLTLQSALRLLGEAGGAEGLVVAPRRSEFNSDKWDYDLNHALRVAIDVECLAQLVHAIVMHDEIGISPGFVHRDGDQAVLRNGYGGFVPAGVGLGEVVTPLAYSERLHRRMLLRAGQRAVEISRTPEFRGHLGALAAGGMTGVILDISNGYFETGYSDPSLLASFELEEENEREAIYVDLALDEMRRVVRRPVAAREHMEASRAFMELAEAMRSIDRGDHALVEAPIPSGYGYDKMSAAYDVVRNTAAGLYYQYVAELAEAPYLPHAIRTPLVAFDPGGPFAADVEGRVVGEVSAARRRRADAVAAVVGDPGFDLEVPLVLARVLRDARTPAEVIPRALELRETSEARRLRAWFRDLHGWLRTDLRSAERELEGLRPLIAGWTGAPAGGGEPGITVGVNLGVVTVEGPVPIRMGRGRRRRRRLRFLYDLARAGDATPRLAPVLANSLGEPIAEAWRQAQETVRRFTRERGPAGGRDSLLDLRGHHERSTS
ncbi:hypothetical protein [Sphaerisporangium aureirubrum]|uniref:Uncharacterized protein n=1 Tax=Sphaerisporangium aureirubrum TaxID=1544736 RepID=A0ABW1NQA3_9ACTN